MPCPIPTVLLSHKPVSGCQHLTHILSSCFNIVFPQTILYCLAGNWTLVSTDRYRGGSFCGRCTVSQVLKADVVVLDSSCNASSGSPSLVSDTSWNVTYQSLKYQITLRKLQTTLWQTFEANYDKICQRNIDLPFLWYFFHSLATELWWQRQCPATSRCETPAWSKPMAQPLFSVLIRAIIKLIINTIRHHVYWLSTQYEIMWFRLQYKHKFTVQVKSRDFTTAWSRSNKPEDLVDLFACVIEDTCRT